VLHAVDAGAGDAACGRQVLHAMWKRQHHVLRQPPGQQVADDFGAAAGVSSVDPWRQSLTVS